MYYIKADTYLLDDELIRNDFPLVNVRDSEERYHIGYLCSSEETAAYYRLKGCETKRVVFIIYTNKKIVDEQVHRTFSVGVSGSVDIVMNYTPDYILAMYYKRQRKVVRITLED